LGNPLRRIIHLTHNYKPIHPHRGKRGKKKERERERENERERERERLRVRERFSFLPLHLSFFAPAANSCRRKKEVRKEGRKEGRGDHQASCALSPKIESTEKDGTGYYEFCCCLCDISSPDIGCQLFRCSKPM
jgi:hypothetical protein